MINKNFIFLFILLSTVAFSQVTLTVDNISKDYVGKIFISDTTEVFSKGWVAIYESGSKKQLIKVESDELTYQRHNGRALANIKELPYGEQSQIMYEDYNFDGKKDFAIMDGQNSCYHGPSFKIYLAKSGGFKYSAEFSRLAQEYCGMFDADPKSKTISTMTKSGCCWHQFSEFIVVDNEPKTVRTVVNEFDFPYAIQSEEIWNGNKVTKSISKTIDFDQEGVTPVLIFYVDDKAKQIILFNINDRTLNYAVVDKAGEVEFSFPIEAVYKSPDFTFDTNDNKISFKNENAAYSIFDTDDKIGIEIITKGKKYNWIGNLKSKRGNLTALKSLKLDNVVIK